MSTAKAPSTTASINRILMAALQPATAQDPLALALQEALDLTGSTSGWLGQIDAAGRLLTVAHLTPAEGGGGTTATWEPLPRAMAQVLWRQLGEDRAVAFHNDGLEPAGPPDHPPTGRLLAARLPAEAGLKALIVVGGRAAPYGAQEARRLEKLAGVLGQVVTAVRASADRALIVATFNACPDGLALCDLNGAITLANPAFLALWGHEGERDPVGWSLFDLCDRGESHADEARHALVQGRTWDLEAACTLPQDGKVPLIVHAAPLRDLVGALAGAAISVRDARREQAVEDRLWRAAQDLARSNRELEGFALTAARELQEPLRKIVAFGEFLQSDCGHRLDACGRDYLARMLAASERQQELLDGLLRFARVQGTRPSMARVDLGQVVRDVVGDLRQQLSASRGSVQVEALPALQCDQALIHLLLRNLVENALKFHRPEAAPVVRISARVEGGWCEILVQDEGIGFDNAEVHRMFQVFGRLHGRQEYGGTGLGLPICQRIAELHGGTVSASSPPEGGALFAVSLPIEQRRGPSDP